jgi:putative ABC transport system substrate-binding protein
LPRIGYLAPTANNRPEVRGAFLEGMREYGYIEGQNVTIEWRFADYDPGRTDAFTEIAAELARMPVDVFVVGGTNQVPFSVQRATRVIPIVASAVAYPVEIGLVKSLAKPDADNLTALAVSAPGQAAKMLDLLHEVVPGLARLAVLVSVNSPVYDVIMWNDARTNAEQLGLQLERFNIRTPDDLEEVFSTLGASRPDALLDLQNPLLLPVRQRFAELTLQHRLPTMTVRDYVAFGALMSYTTNFPSVHRRSAAYVDRILKGARPADLPVEQPTVFDFVVNVNTLTTLGLTIPQSLEPMVSEWIQ